MTLWMRIKLFQSSSIGIYDICVLLRFFHLQTIHDALVKKNILGLEKETN